MFDLSMATYVFVIFIVAGLTKGVVGGGLPVMAIGLLTMVTGLQEAIAIAVIPAFATNIWQASSGGYLRILVRRLWPYLLASIMAVMLGTMLLIAMNASVLTIILGLLIAAYSTLGVAGKEFRISASWEKTTGPVFGFLTGLIAGMTGSPAYPGPYFLNGLGFTRNQLVQAMGLSFSLVTLTVAISMKSNNLLDMNQVALSVFAVAPAMVGMVAGRHLRHKMPEKMFKKLFYSSMLILGGYLVIRSIMRLV